MHALIGAVSVHCPSQADLVLCRDALFHMTAENVSAAIRNIEKSGAKYLMTTYVHTRQ